MVWVLLSLPLCQKINLTLLYFDGLYFACCNKPSLFSVFVLIWDLAWGRNRVNSVFLLMRLTLTNLLPLVFSNNV
jgi:hypothetical protein